MRIDMVFHNLKMRRNEVQFLGYLNCDHNTVTVGFIALEYDRGKET